VGATGYPAPVCPFNQSLGALWTHRDQASCARGSRFLCVGRELRSAHQTGGHWRGSSRCRRSPPARRVGHRGFGGRVGRAAHGALVGLAGVVAVRGHCSFSSVDGWVWGDGAAPQTRGSGRVRGSIQRYFSRPSSAETTRSSPTASVRASSSSAARTVAATSSSRPPRVRRSPRGWGAASSARRRRPGPCPWRSAERAGV
jgi:hypothetical protein